MWRWRIRQRGRGRPMKPRFIHYLRPHPPMIPISYGRIPPPPPHIKPIEMTPDEYEAYILIYYEGLSQEEAALKMGVSRGTLWRSLDSARKKIAEMLATGRPIIVRMY
ncbi:hypothetical protein DRN84_01545 [Candidatus Geothermarchaeota archaeon]|nr:MAG: hypothetical protein DRN87_02150 [Candidatus Geothermarchaeota archaeon]RLG62590.1 MAG: hypothetical protein DRN84_01545 [Candidatus Geothermarchaeota archaeon]HEW94341.1 DUF134 domain-containing protein [Thermoprotei archaeon]